MQNIEGIDTVEYLRNQIEELQRYKQISDMNFSEITNAINHILSRLRVLEDENEPLH